jgi:mono/diheme cytochrome c family protein
VKYLFILVLLVVAAAGGLLGVVVVYRFVNNMTETQKIVPGERVFVMPAGVIPRGGELIYPKEQRELATKQPNPIKMSPASVAIGKERFMTFCMPCHGPEAKGGVSGLVATKFIPTPDLTSPELQKQRTDGYWHSYVMVGGAVMPSYAEALSSTEAWHVVNFLRSVAAK